MAMFDEQIELIKKQEGYDSSKNIADYYFAHKEALLRTISNGESFIHLAEFEFLIRWHSELGKECQKQIRNFITEVQQKSIDEINAKFKINPETVWNYPNTIIDFNNFSFIYDHKKYDLDTFAKTFKTSRIQGLHDLRGIDLSGIQIYNCVISNCMFANANFANSNIYKTKFNGCIFTEVNFDNSRLCYVWSDDKTLFADISIKNTFLDAIDLKNFSAPKNIKIVSYWWLISKFLKTLFPKKDNISFDFIQKHTYFDRCDTRNNTGKEDIEFISYVDWFQYVNQKINNIKEENLINKLKFFIELVTTKYWSSYGAVILFSILINIFFSIIYCLLKNSFNNIKDYWDSLYFSIVTFTTLGFGDITPISHISQLLVIIEVIIGYIVLGIFVFLLSKKVSKLF